ncbi:MAG: DUF1801 domain-containing protein [Sphingomonadales bacterium]|nr:DUF1801 domain-containing protein [Sphingomonadales bacterium]
MSPETGAALARDLLALAAEVLPGAERLEKYGGVVLRRIAGQAGTECCGVFVYRAHVALEFTEGYRLADPAGRLEGGGKRRRHLKLRAPQDIAAKDCRGFLEQLARLGPAVGGPVAEPGMQERRQQG